MTDSTVTATRHSGSRSVARLPLRKQPLTLDACSICLRVRDNSQWIEADTAIRAFRSFEHEAPPRLRPAVCDDCAYAIALRRSRDPVARAA
jgi:hypothetical protein